MPLSQHQQMMKKILRILTIAPPKVLLRLPTNRLKERLSAKRMRQWSRAKASADGSRPRSAPQDLSVHGWTDAAVPRMARSGTHATEHDVSSAACAMDGIACGQKYQRFGRAREPSREPAVELADACRPTKTLSSHGLNLLAAPSSHELTQLKSAPPQSQTEEPSVRLPLSIFWIVLTVSYFSFRFRV